MDVKSDSLIQSPDDVCFSKNISDRNTMIPSVPSTKQKTYKSSTDVKSPNLIKVKFKKDDSKKTNLKKSKKNKKKLIKIILNDVKNTYDQQSKQLLLNNSPNKKYNTNSSETQHVNNSEKESEIESLNSSNISKNINECNSFKNNNFEELLEDIEAEAKLYIPIKSMPHHDKKQKKKRIPLFGKRRRQLKKKNNIPKNNENRKNVHVKLSPQAKKICTTNSPDKLNNSNDITTQTHIFKPTLPINCPSESSVQQKSPSFYQLANNTALNKIEMQASDVQSFICPKQECRKQFRKNNLLLMHIKHYHSEYTGFLVATPNVIDIATARVEGKNIDELIPSNILQKISQLEATKIDI